MSTSPSQVDIGTPGNTDDAAPAPQIHDNRHANTDANLEHESHENELPEDDTRRCFICLVDEPAASLPADWVTPCKCTLEGHQSCLLTWVADLEMQGKTVKCPLCKSQIEVLDRWDPAVQLSDTLTRYVSGLSPWYLLTLGTGGMFLSSVAYGMHALDVFAGPDAVTRFIFRAGKSDHYLDTLLWRARQAVPTWITQTPIARDPLGRAGDIAANGDASINWARLFSLSLVAPVMVLNRLYLGEAVMIPSSLMYAMFIDDHRADMFSWPPSPQKAGAALPIVKAFYFHVHRALSKRLDQRLQAVATETQNLQGETAEQAVARREAAQAPAAEEDNHIIDIQFDLNLGVGDNDQDAEPENLPQNNNAAPAARPNRPGNGLGSLLNYLSGALMWPTLSYGAGSLLRLVLPPAWVTKPRVGPTTGLLQERWGRSLVGGCLFVVLKDAFFLYVKWRRAINRPYRRIRNVDRRPR